MHQNPKHYALAPRLLGSDFVARVQALAPGLWFNPYVKVKDGELIPPLCDGGKLLGRNTRLPRCARFFSGSRLLLPNADIS